MPWVPVPFDAGAKAANPVLVLALTGGKSAIVTQAREEWIVAVDDGCLYKICMETVEQAVAVACSDTPPLQQRTLFDCMGIDVNTVRVSFSRAVGIDDKTDEQRSGAVQLSHWGSRTQQTGRDH